ncbi:alpha/beta-Hydrolases superfamily protein [Actinidia rufa]|uniref:Alpha/beta-Hydrolases superfamily protein n=1 Tax=Actinidia rufa TaxID=165716 RepID=A0A7J0FGG4_9ERIC|nr:alpha/beta-Hydrolases superfamily protein [Actinidia rufa]
MDTSGEDTLRYMILRPENGGIRDLLRFLVSADRASAAKFVETSDEDAVAAEFLGSGGDDDGDGGDVPPDHRWVIFVSIVIRKVIALFGKPLEWSGYLFEFFLNLLSENGNLLGLLYNLLFGKVVMPQRGSETFISAIGHLDERINLYKSNSLVEGASGLQVEIGNRTVMDLYYQRDRSTQVFILCDKPKDANLILISFRGTEPFDANDWSTDFDYSWYEIPKLGKVHMGFLEALGLGNRANTSTFQNLLQVKDAKFTSLNEVDTTTEPSESNAESEGLANDGEKTVIPEMVEMTAYFVVKSKLKSLLNEHKTAKFIVTGHSLGGALAILFPTVLVLHEERELMQRLAGVYTYGQPRVGNWQLRRFMEAHLEYPVPKYFRVVYCNDLVPRLPYDNRTFLYKHFGECLYYNSLYTEQKVDEEPNRNYFGMWYLIPEYLNAVWELIRSLIMGYTHGPEYKEGWLSVLLRVVGLAVPGISAHSPTNYVNSIRLGRNSAIRMSSL